MIVWDKPGEDADVLTQMHAFEHATICLLDGVIAMSDVEAFKREYGVGFVQPTICMGSGVWGHFQFHDQIAPVGRMMKFEHTLKCYLVRGHGDTTHCKSFGQPINRLREGSDPRFQ